MKRIRCMLAIAVLTPATLTAQQPRVAPATLPANPISTTLLSFGYYGTWLRQAFDSIPGNKYDFKPTRSQQSVGYIAQHVENANYQLCATFSGDKYVMTAKDSLADTIKAKWPKDTLTARLKASLVYCRNAFARVTDTNLTDSLPGRGGNKSLRISFLLSFITDLAEHYSQIASYMRIIGMVPPSALPRSPGALNE